MACAISHNQNQPLGGVMEKGKIVVIRHGERKSLGTGKTWENRAGLTAGCKTWETMAGLTNNGLVQTRDFAIRYGDLLKNCKIFATSPLVCAQETLYKVMETLVVSVNEYDKIIYSQDLWTHHPAEYMSGDSSFTAAALATANPRLANEDGQIALRFIGDIGIRMGKSSEKVALLISHGGPIDFLYVALRMRLEPIVASRDFGECEGMVITVKFEGSKIVLDSIEEIRNPTSDDAT